MSACHKHKVSKFHYRNQENKTLLPFYKKHYKCMIENKYNLETKEDQIQDESWMGTYPEEEEKPATH